jgi:hypothetical protein
LSFEAIATIQFLLTMAIHVDFIEQALHQLDELEALGQGFFNQMYNPLFITLGDKKHINQKTRYFIIYRK